MSYTSEEMNSFSNAARSNKEWLMSVNGKTDSDIFLKKSTKFGASIVAIIIVILLMVITIYGQSIPVHISNILAETTDMQHADMVKSMEIAYQQSLRDGDFDENAAISMKEKGMLVGYVDGEDFIEATYHEDGLVIKFKNKIITPDEFISMMNDVEFFDIVTSSSPMFSQAMGYHDEAARDVFRKIGTSRNNFTGESKLNEVVSKKIGEGSDVDVNSVSLVKKTRKNERGETEIYWEYEENGAPASSKNSSTEYINGVIDKNPAKNSNEAALYSADTLAIADMMTTKERASLLYALYQESPSKMKAREGSEARVNDVMNSLNEYSCSIDVDIDTAEVIEECGTAFDDPSFYAILSGQKVSPEEVKNSSSERILKTIENQLGVNRADAAMLETIVSSSRKKGLIGRFISSGIEKASTALLNLVEPTVSSSLVDNSYQAIKGKKLGRALVVGAVNVSAELAKKSGGTVGDVQAIIEYARVNSEIIAMEQKVDRMNRSPFDITSKNTFLGSIIYNFAISMRRVGSLSVLASFSSMISSVKQAAVSLMPKSYADEISTYLTSFGDCERYERIGAKGTAGCWDNITFDTSTYDAFNDLGFVSFVEQNTILENGVRTVRRGSYLWNFITYNERETPVGTIDGGILESLKSGSSSASVSSILGMVETSLEANEAEKRIASGEAFVNSVSNPDWEIYKYAQRYVSIARAAAALRQYSKGTAYQNLRFFEGNQNPVIAVLEEYYASR